MVLEEVCVVSKPNHRETSIEEPYIQHQFNVNFVLKVWLNVCEGTMFCEVEYSEDKLLSSKRLKLKTAPRTIIGISVKKENSCAIGYVFA